MFPFGDIPDVVLTTPDKSEQVISRGVFHALCWTSVFGCGRIVVFLYDDTAGKPGVARAVETLGLLMEMTAETAADVFDLEAHPGWYVKLCAGCRQDPSGSCFGSFNSMFGVAGRSMLHLRNYNGRDREEDAELLRWLTNEVLTQYSLVLVESLVPPEMAFGRAFLTTDFRCAEQFRIRCSDAEDFAATFVVRDN